MIKVAIVTKKMVIGGTEKALIPMLKQFDPQEYEVDLYLQELGGALYEELPEWVHAYKMPAFGEMSLKEKIRHPLRLGDAILKRASMNEDEPYYKQCERACHCMPMVEKEYDIAIAYHAPDAVPFFYVIHNLKARQKIMWLHFDIEQTNAVNALAKKYFSRYDKIFAVSNQAKETFERNYPEMADKSEVFYNLVDTEGIIRQSECAPSYQDGFSGIRILSIGRLTEPKGYDLFLPVLRRLLDEGYDLRFYICGDGEKRQELEGQIRQLQLDGRVLLLGMQSNPYGFLKDCDIYVQPSRFEAFCTTTNEARIFCKPVVVTDVCGMREQFEDHVNGTIVSLEEDALYDGVKELLDDRKLRETYSDNLASLKLDRKIDLKKLF
jgi:glycosyltransferase involved in cell wall biosynthesis